MSKDNNKMNKVNLLIGGLIGIITTLVVVLTVVLTGQAETPIENEGNTGVSAEEAEDSTETKTDNGENQDTHEESLDVEDEDVDTVSSATVHWESVDSPDDGWETTFTYPYPYSEATNRANIPYVEDIRDVLIANGLENGSSEDKRDMMNKHFGEDTSLYLESGMIPSLTYSPWANEALYDIADASFWEHYQDFENLDGYGTIDPWSRDYAHFEVDTPYFREIHLNIDSGYLTDNGNDFHGEFLEMDELVVGGFHLHETRLDSNGIEGIPHTDNVNMDISAFEQDIDFSEFMNGLFDREAFVRITYFVRPVRRMNKIEFLERAKQLTFDLNGYTTEPIPHLFDDDYEMIHHIFGSDHESRGQADGLYQTYDSYVEEARTILPKSYVAMMHQYLPVTALQATNNTLIYNGETFHLPEAVENYGGGSINRTRSIY